jgi:hypothetical protein
MSTLFDLVVMTPSSAFGTSAIIPLGAGATVNGVTYLSFASAGATGGQQVSYSILDAGNSEIGTATYLSSNATLTGRTPTKSTNGNAVIVATSAALIQATVRGEDLNGFIVAGQLPGTSNGSSATSGNVGEYIESVIASSQQIALASGIPQNITAVSLTAGDWDVSADITYNPAATTNYELAFHSISATSSTQDQMTPGAYSIDRLPGGGVPVANFTTAPVGPIRKSVPTTTSFNLVAQATFTISTMAVYGFLRARRMR